MFTKAEALRIILAAAPAPAETDRTPLDDALGRVLARDAVAERDMPAFDRSAVDGWAVRAADAGAAGARLRIAGRVMAGAMPERALRPGEAMKVMTGAPVPEGADSMVMVEQSREEPDGAEVVLLAAAVSGANISRRAEDFRAGEVLLRAGMPLDAAALGLLAMMGVDPVPTWRPPAVCVIPTGDELVPAGHPLPGPACIRESNGALLAAQVRQVSPALRPLRPGIARDALDSLRTYLDVGLDHDVLILSGGVSMGDLDLVGGALKGRGLETLVEKVAIKPGKPLLFGRLRHRERNCHVFGLPGNPVSSFVTFELFVRPFLLALLGHPDPRPPEITARLGGRDPLRGIPRTQHVPAAVRAVPDGFEAEPLRWHGSGDLRGLAGADGLILVDTGSPPIEPGAEVRVHRLPGRPLREAAPGARRTE